MEATAKKIIRESVPVLTLCTLGGVLAGIILMRMTPDFNKIPGLIILLPAILGNRGNISGALGSRLGSALHLGLISPELRWNNTLKINIYASLILNFVMSFILGVVAYYASVLTGLFSPDEISIMQLTLISIFAGTLAGIALTVLSVIIAIMTYSRGYDPDNVLAPSLSTIGDFITVICLFLAVKLIVG
ncbi:MAG: magnesium transporter [Candidatus Altiarchaeota archaeon]